MQHDFPRTAVDSLEDIDGVSSVRRQPPHLVLTVEHPPLDNAITLREIEAESEREHESVVNALPSWATVSFTNAIEVFVTIDEEEYLEE